MHPAHALRPEASWAKTSLPRDDVGATHRKLRTRGLFLPLHPLIWAPHPTHSAFGFKVCEKATLLGQAGTSRKQSVSQPVCLSFCQPASQSSMLAASWLVSQPASQSITWVRRQTAMEKLAHSLQYNEHRNVFNEKPNEKPRKG